jgi:hypothetical protein
LNQLTRVEAPPLPPEIAREREEAKKKRRLEHELRPSIQKKLIGYMSQDKEKSREFDLSVDYVLILNNMQGGKCASCNIKMKWEWNQPGDVFQWTVDRINNNLGHIKGNVCFTCLECNRNHRDTIPKMTGEEWISKHEHAKNHPEIRNNIHSKLVCR